MKLLKFITTMQQKEIYINPEYIVKIEGDAIADEEMTIIHLLNSANVIYVKGCVKENAEKILNACDDSAFAHR